jgi:hypothetical protein
LQVSFEREVEGAVEKTKAEIKKYNKKTEPDWPVLQQNAFAT